MIPLLFVLLLILVVLRVPVLLAIAAVGALGMAISPDANLPFFVQRSFSAIDSFSLLALPYFILAGSIMARGGLSRSLVDLFQIVFGRMRGSLGLSAVGASVGMANVSGSSTAEAATIGSILIPEMKRSGYPSGLAAAIVGASATIGPVIPPSMTMIIYGSMAGVSIGGLFLAGVVPGLLMAAGLSIVIYALSFRTKYAALNVRTHAPSLSDLLAALNGSLVALIAPVIILGGIFAGIFTATEAGIVTCIYALLASIFYYRSFERKDVLPVLVDTAVMSSVVVGIIAMAGSLGWLMSFYQFNETVLAAIKSLTDNPITVLVLLVLVMLTLSMFLESLAVLVVFVPTIVLVTQDYGFDPLHIGVVMVITTQLGALSPPVAVLQFITSQIANTSLSETFHHSWFLIACLLAVLFAIIAFPAITLTLPHWSAS